MYSIMLMKKIILFLIFVILSETVLAEITMFENTNYNPSLSNVTYKINTTFLGVTIVKVNTTCLTINTTTFCNVSATPITIIISNVTPPAVVAVVIPCRSFDFLNHSTDPTSLFSINCSGDIDINFGRLSFPLGEIIENFKDSWIRIRDNLQVNHINSSGNFTGNQIYANIRFHNDSGITIDLTTSEVYKPIFGYNVTKMNGFNFNGTALNTIISGNYESDWGVSFGGNANEQHGFDVLVNSNPQDCHGHRTITTGNAIGVVSIPCVISLITGDNVTSEVRDEAGAVTNPTFIEASLYLMRIGDVK